MQREIPQTVIGDAQASSALIAGVFLEVDFQQCEFLFEPKFSLNAPLGRGLFQREIPQTFIGDAQNASAFIVCLVCIVLFTDDSCLMIQLLCFLQYLRRWIHQQHIGLQCIRICRILVAYVPFSDAQQHLFCTVSFQMADDVFRSVKGIHKRLNNSRFLCAQGMGKADGGLIPVGLHQLVNIIRNSLLVLAQIKQQVHKAMLVQVGDALQGGFGAAGFHQVGGDGTGAQRGVDAVLAASGQQVIPEALGEEGNQLVLAGQARVADQRAEDVQLLLHVILVVAGDGRQQRYRDGLIGHAEHRQQGVLHAGQGFVLAVVLHSAVQVLGVALLQALGKGVVGQLEAFFGGFLEQQGQVLKIAVAGVKNLLLQRIAVAAQGLQIPADELVQVIAAVFLVQLYALGLNAGVDGAELAEDARLRAGGDQDGHAGRQLLGVLAQHLDQRSEAGRVLQLVQAVDDQQVPVLLVLQRLDKQELEQPVVVQIIQVVKAPVPQEIPVALVRLREDVGQVFEGILDVAGLGTVENAHMDGPHQLLVGGQVAHEGGLACARFSQEDKNAVGIGIIQNPAAALLQQPLTADEIVQLGHGDEILIGHGAADSQVPLEFGIGAGLEEIRVAEGRIDGLQLFLQQLLIDPAIPVFYGVHVNIAA